MSFQTRRKIGLTCLLTLCLSSSLFGIDDRRQNSVSTQSSSVQMNSLEKGKLHIGGNFVSSSREGDDVLPIISSIVSINELTWKDLKYQVLFGYNIKKNNSIGVSFGYVESVIKPNFDISLLDATYDFQSQSSGWTLTPYYTRYVPVLGSQWCFLVARGVIELESRTGTTRFVTGEGEEESIENRTNEKTSWRIGVDPGMSFFLSPRFNVEATVGMFNYHYSNTKNIKSDNSISTFTTSEFRLKLDILDLAMSIKFYL